MTRGRNPYSDERMCVLEDGCEAVSGAHLGFIWQHSPPRGTVQHTEYKLWISQRLTPWTSLLPSLPGLQAIVKVIKISHFLPTPVNFIARSCTPRPASPAVSFMVLCVMLIRKKVKTICLENALGPEFRKFWRKFQKILLGFKMSASFKARLWNDYFSKI